MEYALQLAVITPLTYLSIMKLLVCVSRSSLETRYSSFLLMGGDSSPPIRRQHGDEEKNESRNSGLVKRKMSSLAAIHSAIVT